MAADLLYFAAQIDHTDAPVLYGAAHTALRGGLSGDPERDRGNYMWLATLQSRSGDLDGAVAFLDEASAHWPDNPTFHASAARLLLKAGRHEDCLKQAERGLRLAWGDNYLTMAKAKAQALVALHRTDDAKAFVTEVLAKNEAPGDGVDVRSHQYRAALQKVVEPPAKK